MKKILVFASLALGLFAAQATMGQFISGTPHDFRDEVWNNTGTGTNKQICITCHTPHNAVADSLVLWSHTLSTATYTVYGSSTMNAIVGQPDGSSKLCLSCHDGTVALNNFVGNGTATDVFATGPILMGTTLDNDHPVSFTYNTALATADGGLKDPASVPAVSALLFNGKVQCSSCHDAHNNLNGNFLVMSNNASALCLTCHTK